jgi:hypothetical protein
LGFDSLALTEAAISLSADPGNYSAHRFLAETYETLPRSVVSRESEFLQSQIRQSLGLSAISPFRGQANPFSAVLPLAAFPAQTGPGRIAFNEFNPLFLQNGLSVSLDGLVGSEDTNSYQGVVSGLTESASFSVGQGRFTTSGFDPNSDYLQDATSAFLHLQVSDNIQLQGEYLATGIERGEVFSEFDPIYATNVRSEEDSHSYRINGRIEIGPKSDIVFSTINQIFEADLFFPDIPDTAEFDGRARATELQYLSKGDIAAYLLGANLTESDIVQVSIPLAFPSAYRNSYGYAFLSPRSLPLQIQLGLSLDSFETDEIDRDAVCPKLGSILNISPTTILRAAAARSVKRPFTGERTIEPTQVVGFSQFFDDPDGAVAWQYGVALDQLIGRGSHVGIDVVDREIEVPFFTEYVDWTETRSRAYLYLPIPGDSSNTFPFTWSWALTAEFEIERIRRPEGVTGFEGIVSLDTYYLPLGLTAFPGARTSIHVKTTRVEQDGTLQVTSGSDMFDVTSGFWVTDFAVAYRLDRRRGTATVGISNLEDRQFTYVNSDPSMARFATGRIVYGRLTLQF